MYLLTTTSEIIATSYVIFFDIFVATFLLNWKVEVYPEKSISVTLMAVTKLASFGDDTPCSMSTENIRKLPCMKNMKNI